MISTPLAAVSALPSRQVRPLRLASRIRLFIADEHALFRQALRCVLETDGSFEVVGEASDGMTALQEIQRTCPDVVLVDLGLPSLNGIEVTLRLRRAKSSSKVVLLASRSQEHLLIRSLNTGAAGYLLKDADLQELTIALRKVQAGFSYVSLTMDPWPAFAAARPASSKSDARTDVLTSRERELLQLVGEGYTNKEIAERLCLSVKTVEAHKANICGKLNLRGQANLIRHAICAGMAGIGA